MAAADYRLMTEATGQRIAAALEILVNLGDPVTIAHGGTGASTAAAALAALGGVAVTDIVDNLTSTATNKPLSAAQGKALNDKLTSAMIDVTSQLNNVAVAAGVFRIDIPVTVPAGYTMVGVLTWNFGARINVSITGIDVYDGQVHIFGINNGESNTVSPTAKVLCVKQ